MKKIFRKFPRHRFLLASHSLCVICTGSLEKKKKKTLCFSPVLEARCTSNMTSSHYRVRRRQSLTYFCVRCFWHFGDLPPVFHLLKNKGCIFGSPFLVEVVFKVMITDPCLGVVLFSCDLVLAYHISPFNHPASNHN
jgi:hypothetical protein